MRIEQLRQRFAGLQDQVVKITPDGTLIESCNTVFDLTEKYGSSIFNEFPFLRGMEPAIHMLWPGDPPFCLPGMALQIEGKELYCDLEFHRLEVDKEFSLVWLVKERTSIYLRMQEMQQGKNESMIQNEIIERQRWALQRNQERLERANQELDRFAYMPPEALLDHYADQPFSKKPLSKRIIDTFQLGLAGKQEKGVSCSICYMDFKNGKNES